MTESCKKKIFVFSAVVILILSFAYFFPKPLEDRLSLTLDESCVIQIRYDEIVFNSGKPNEIVTYQAECDLENGLIDEAIKLFEGTKTISHPVNLLPWKISKWDGFDITIAIANPAGTGEWMHFDEKEILISQDEFKVYRITNKDFANKVVEFVKEQGTVME